MRRRRRAVLWDTDQDDDPLSGVANLFDIAMVFAVALMVALVANLHLTEIFSNERTTIVKNPGKENMEILVKDGTSIERYKATSGSGEGKGRRLGTAYELADGQVVYVPESGAP